MISRPFGDASDGFGSHVPLRLAIATVGHSGRVAYTSFASEHLQDGQP